CLNNSTHISIMRLTGTCAKLKKEGSQFIQKGRKRGVMILISNAIQFETLKEMKNKEGRYILNKGKIENQLVTLVNVYAHPDSDKRILICGGDFNITLNQDLDTTSTKKSSKIQVSQYLNTVLTELGISDIYQTGLLLIINSFCDFHQAFGPSNKRR
uniref:Uncharacterized protein n=1 Tax=Sander lucioperca TaxID=283035 RepID=A0A8C9YBG1_SANLU